MRHIPDPLDRPWLTVSELSEITGEGEKVIRAAISAGQLPVLRVGRYVRIPTAALRRQVGLGKAADEPTDHDAEWAPTADAWHRAMRTEPHRVTQSVADTLGVSRATALRRIAAARKAGAIPMLGDHRPATARWAGVPGESWLACRECKMPWPCPDAS